MPTTSERLLPDDVLAVPGVLPGAGADLRDERLLFAAPFGAARVLASATHANLESGGLDAERKKRQDAIGSRHAAMRLTIERE